MNDGRVWYQSKVHRLETLNPQGQNLKPRGFRDTTLQFVFDHKSQGLIKSLIKIGLQTKNSTPFMHIFSKPTFFLGSLQLGNRDTRERSRIGNSGVFDREMYEVCSKDGRSSSRFNSRGCIDDEHQTQVDDTGKTGACPRGIRQVNRCLLVLQRTL